MQSDPVKFGVCTIPLEYAIDFGVITLKCQNVQLTLSNVQNWFSNTFFQFKFNYTVVSTRFS